MSMSYKKSKNGNYYINSMTVQELAKYYEAGGKEPPGRWYFAPAPGETRAQQVMRMGELGDFGLKDGAAMGTNDVDAYMDLCSGYNPDGGKKLVQNAGEPERVAVHDFTMSPPKSFSVAWGMSNEAIKKQMANAQYESARDALDYFSEMGAWTRQGKGGHIKTRTAFVAALFEHGSSREDDMHLHTHCTILNVCRRQDGSTGTIETLDAMKWQGAVASMYHAGIAYRARQLGFAIKMDGKIPDIEGIPSEVIEEFSQRKKQIEAAVEKWQTENGMTPDASRASRGLLKKVWHETRDQKTEKSREELQALWIERGKAIGFTEVQVREVMSLGEPLEKFTPEKLLQEARAAVEKLTETDAVFKEPALHTAVAVHLCGRANIKEIREAIESVKLELVQTQVLIDTKRGETECIYSTREMLGIERDLISRIQQQTPEHALNAKVIDAFIASQDEKIREAVTADWKKKNKGQKLNEDDIKGLEAEQKAAIRASCLGTNQVSVIEGTAGAGKTFTAKSIAEAYKAAGYKVEGLSGAWAQALTLQKEAGLDSGRAIAGWLADIENGKLHIDEKTLVLVDEAGMVGVKDMRNVVRAAQEAGARVIMLGDTLQQSAVSAGDALRVTVEKIGSTRLDVIRRQRNEEDKKAVYEFFAGKADVALDRYKGRVHIAANAQETNALIVKDWMASRAKHPDKSHLIIALDNASSREINDLAHQARKSSGQLGKNSFSMQTLHSKDATDLIEFSEGDNIVFRGNNKGISTADKESREVLSQYKAFTSDLTKLQSETEKLESKILANVEKAKKSGVVGYERSAEHIDQLQRLAGLKTEFEDRLDAGQKHFDSNANMHSKDIARAIREQIELSPYEIDRAGALRLHSTDVGKRIRESESEKAENVYNRVRGTIEKVDPKSGKMLIRTEEGKVVDFDPKDQKWQHKKDGKDNGVAIALDYSCSIYASQGLTRDVVFVKDHHAMGRKQIGVAMSRHRDDCHVYVDKEDRYKAKMRQTDATEWHHIDKFSDAECLERMKNSYAREGVKASTLDFEKWTDAKGVELYPEAELSMEHTKRVREQLENIRTMDSPRVALEECPFQLEPHYVLPEPEFKSAIGKSNAPLLAADRLGDDGIHGSVFAKAQSQGFMSFYEDGTVGFNGRRPSDDAVVNRIRDGKVESGALRNWYPPILKGSKKEVHLVRTGEDALALWSMRHQKGLELPTVIVARDSVRDATSLKHVRELLAGDGVKVIANFDTKVQGRELIADERNIGRVAKKDVAISKDKVTLKEQAKAEEAVRKQGRMAEVEREELRRKPVLGL